MVEKYLVALPPETQSALQSLRQIIRSAAPKAEETISYRMPTFLYHGNLVHYSAFENHCSFFAGSGRVREEFAGELKVWPGTKSSIHFTPERPIPPGLVKRIVRWRIAENMERRGKLELRRRQRKKAT